MQLIQKPFYTLLRADSGLFLTQANRDPQTEPIFLHGIYSKNINQEDWIEVTSELKQLLLEAYNTLS